jgi:hypothetical protein
VSHPALPTLEAWFAEAWCRQLPLASTGLASVISAVRKGDRFDEVGRILLAMVARSRADPATLSDRQLLDTVEVLVARLLGEDNAEVVVPYRWRRPPSRARPVGQSR